MMMIEPAPHELSRTVFIATFGSIYEHSPWVAETLYDQGLSKDDFIRGEHYEIMMVANIVNLTYGRGVGDVFEEEIFM